jgi:hypothetical protein
MCEQLESYIQARLSSTSEYWAASQQQYNTLGPLKHVLMEQIRAREGMKELKNLLEKLQCTTAPSSPLTRDWKLVQPALSTSCSTPEPSSGGQDLAAEIRDIRTLLQQLVGGGPQPRPVPRPAGVAASGTDTDGPQESVLVFTAPLKQSKARPRPPAIDTGSGPSSPISKAKVGGGPGGARLPGEDPRTGLGGDRLPPPVSPLWASHAALRSGSQPPSFLHRAAAHLRSVGPNGVGVQTPPPQRWAGVAASDPGRSPGAARGGRIRCLYSSMSNDLVLERPPYAGSRRRLDRDGPSTTGAGRLSSTSWCETSFL